MWRKCINAHNSTRNPMLTINVSWIVILIIAGITHATIVLKRKEFMGAGGAIWGRRRGEEKKKGGI